MEKGGSGTQCSEYLLPTSPNIASGSARGGKDTGRRTPPPPEQQRFGRALARWSNFPGIPEIAVGRLVEGDFNLAGARQRPPFWIEARIGSRRMERNSMPIVLTLQREVKRRLLAKQNRDQVRAIVFLAEDTPEPSVASKIYRRWHLDRQFIKDCHIAMSGDRSLQVTFNNIIGTTRFNTSQGAQLVRARCSREGRGRVDARGHVLPCYQVSSLGGLRRVNRVEFFVSLCKRRKPENLFSPDHSDLIFGRT